MPGVGVWLALTGCNGGNPWKEVGPARPGDLRLELGEPDGLAIAEASVPLVGVDVDRCEARPSHTALLGTWWVVPPMPLRLEGGPWCGLSLTFDGPLELAGDGLSATLDLPDLDLVVGDALRVDGDAFVLHLGEDGWLSEADLVDGAVAPGDPAHDALVDALVGSAALFRDDEDGVLSEDELAEGSLTVE